MSRTFAYARVSTSDQTTDNQIEEIRNAGFAIEAHRVITEVVSGSEAAVKRPGFVKLLDRLERGDVLIVSRIDRLGRNAMDVAATVKRLADMGVRVHCLQLGGADLTSAAGKMVMTVLSAMAEFERDLLIERTQAGLARAKQAGRKPGRPDSLNDAQQAQVRAALAGGTSVSALARKFGTSRQTILRVKVNAAELQQTPEPPASPAPAPSPRLPKVDLKVLADKQAARNATRLDTSMRLMTPQQPTKRRPA